MDGRGGCCIARCGGAAYDTSKIDRIMLRFRPIAPKPVTSVEDKAPEDHTCRSQKPGRGRKKINKGSSMCKKRKLVVTLPLLPEAPDHTAPLKGHKTPVWLSFDGSVNESMQMWPRNQREVARTWVIVECITDTWRGSEMMVLGRTDEEKRRVLGEDTCPGLISDAWNRVWWTNKAYREMASRGGRREALEEDAEVGVWVVMKERVAVGCEAFTCRVRVLTAGGGWSVTSPCDAWRMSGGGFAWRLDVKAALSLGR